MITLIKAFKLTRIDNDEIVYLRPLGESKYGAFFITRKQVSKQYDMRKIKVHHIEPRFDFYGHFEGMEFEVQGITKEELIKK